MAAACCADIFTCSTLAPEELDGGKTNQEIYDMLDERNGSEEHVYNV